MKISNSKKELARIISENGGWRDGEFAAQDACGVVHAYRQKPVFSSGGAGFGHGGGLFHKICETSKLPNWHQTILSRAEYFHLHPAPDSDGWIEHDGKHEPEISTSGLTIWCKWSDGLEQSHEANMVDWIDDSDVRVVAYRLHKPAQAEPEFCESVERSIPEPEYKPSIERLMHIHCDRAHALSDKKAELLVAERQESEALDAIKAACKEAGFDISPIERLQEKQDPELVITDWRDLRVGDEVECLQINTTGDDYADERIGTIGLVSAIEGPGRTGQAVNLKFNDDEYFWVSGWRFIRRQ